MSDIAIVVGATGLVGRQLVSELSERYAQVVCVVRHAPDKPCHNVVYETLNDFSDLPQCICELSTRYDLDGSDAFSTLGTTQKDAGSKHRFHEVDYGFNSAFALACQQAGSTRLFLLSSLGADSSSKTSFYLRTKGELEDAVAKLRYHDVFVFQPSLLLGEHAGRFAENMGQKLFGLVKGVVPKHAMYRPIEAERVAQAMAKTAHVVARKPELVTIKIRENGLKIIDNAAMLKMTS